MLVGESGKFPDLAALYYREVVTPALPILKGVIERGIAAGEFRATPARDFPQTIVGPALLAVFWQILFTAHHPLEIDGYFAAIFVHFMLGVLTSAILLIRTFVKSEAAVVRQQLKWVVWGSALGLFTDLLEKGNQGDGLHSLGAGRFLGGEDDTNARRERFAEPTAAP